MRMRKYSRVYKVGERKFRYNYEENILEYIHVKTEKDEAFNKEWMEEFGEPFMEFTDGVAIIDSIGLGLDNWRDCPRYWCETYAFELDETCHYLMQEFI